ncbi:membrane protein [Arthrobacter phage Atuin]|nr:membrane protein [Arthrobacter phage Atuin]
MKDFKEWWAWTKGDRFMVWFYVGLVIVSLPLSVSFFVMGFWQGGCIMLIVLGMIGFITYMSLVETVLGAKRRDAWANYKRIEREIKDRHIERYRQWKREE